MTTNKPYAALLRRLLVACAALLAASIPVLAQTVAPETATPPKEPALQLSKFEVRSTQDTGYIANNSATGFKTNQELIKIPQSVTVVTRDLIDDIGATKTSDVLQFAGASQFYRGESIRLRGARTLNAYLDDAIENVPYSDNVDIDSYEVIRGPAGVLYANASVGGVVLKATKKPLPYALDKINFSINDWGQYRSELDATGPLGELGDAKISYRMVAAVQGGNSYFKNTKDDRLALHPTFEVDFKNTTVRFAVDYIDLTNIAGGQNFVLPDGTLYTGAGRDEGYYAKGIMENHKQLRERVAILHRMSPNWESKTSISHLKYERKGTNLLPVALDLTNNTFTLFARRNYQRAENWVLNQDFLGNYHIGPIENQTAAGFTLTDEYVRAAFTNSTTFGTNGRQAFNIADPQLDSVVVPTYDSYIPVASTGSWTNNRRSTFYVQQQATVIPDRVILVGGVSRATLQINDVPAVAARLSAGGTRIVSFDENLHRYGVVINATKDIAFFALDSTTFAPQGNSNTRDINGVLLPAQVGTGKEYGIKTALFGGKLSATISHFDTSLTNVAVLQGGISPVTGLLYFAASGVQNQVGWDGTVAWSPIPEWQILVTGYKGTVKDQNGVTVNNSYSSLYSFFTRYDFKNDTFKGFSIGGGASKTGGNIFTSLGGYTFPVGVTQPSITLESVWNASMFVSYRYSKHWNFRLNVTNLLDKSFAMGAQSPLYVDASPPRTYQFTAAYRF
ncbi:Outer membrane receptor for ferric coprogen and ferric-rhodotorulic acid [Opitutus sp. GAS368]|nr:Outer membrane receptor for ferric coprogen and ferric-rhodotorulic acid [Opitutus sp. GAS368]